MKSFRAWDGSNGIVSSRKVIIALLVAFVFCLANFDSYLRMPTYPEMADGFIYFGWPFSVYGSGGFAGQSAIILTGLIGNVFVALCTARVLGTVVDKFLTAKIPSFTKIRRILI
jgi:hypothetical protein